MKWYNKLKIGTKIVLAVSILLLIALGLTGIVSYSRASSGLYNAISKDLVDRAEDNASMITKGMDLLVIEAEGVASKARIQTMDWEIQKATLIDEVKRINCIRMGVADKSGKASFTDGSTTDLSSESYFQKAIQGTINITDPLISKVDNKMVVVIATPIKNANGEVSGVLFITHENRIISDMITGIKVGNTGYAFAINKEGTTIAHPKNELVVNQDNDFENIKSDPKLQQLVDIEKKMVNGEKGFGEYSYEGVSKFMAYAPISGTEWSIALTVPKNDLFGDIDSLRNQVLVLIAIFLAFGITISLLISKFLISNPISKLVKMSEKVAIGDVDVNFEIKTKDEIGLLMEAFKKIVDNIRENSIVAEKIAAGNLQVDIIVKSEKDVLSKSIITVAETLKSLISEAGILSKAAVEGKLDTRGNTDKFEGAYKEIVEGVNNTLDSVVGPLNVAAEYVDRISKGDIPPKITDNYNGDFNEIKNNLNTCIDAVNALVADAGILVKAAIEGELDTRADAGKHGGEFGKIVDGVNKTLDAIVQPLNIALAYIKKMANGEELEVIENVYKGQYGVLIGNLSMVRDSLYTLLDESGKLTAAASKGNLSYRADTGKLKGGYSTIVEGINKTLDAVIEPVKEASAVLQEMAKGNLHVNVKGNYMGDHAEIKDALNYTINTILSYVSEVSGVLTEMANGNLDVGITADYRGDFVEMKDSLNNIVKSLNEVLGDINSAADQVASGSRQVSDGSQSLSQGSTEQASSIEELSASITEIAVQTKQNAIDANQANELALSAKENAAQGNEQMKEMLKSMVEINSSSANISKIIKVIDEIAFQTNILALNAAVEAARAGQHGKGFAVVAEEVRNLAARSANAAKETTALIEGSISKVEAGTKIANLTAEALNRIVTGVDKAANLVGDIASASNEQASGIAQINKGIEQVSQVVQTNSATAEESAAASEELSSQSELLKDMVSRFNLKRDSKNQGKTGLSAFEDGRNKDFGEYSRKASTAIRSVRSEAAAAGGKLRIALSEKEFGKY